MTPTGLLGNLITNELYKKDKEELLESSSSKKKITAFKAKAESSDDEDEEEENSDKEYALIVRRMKIFMKRRPHRSFNFNKYKKDKEELMEPSSSKKKITAFKAKAESSD